MARFSCVLSVAISAAVCGPALAGGGLGPDIIVGDIVSVGRFGVINGVGGYSVGTTACNIGTFRANWLASTSEHPVIAQNLFRVSTVSGAKRFEQLAQSWLKHGFIAATQDWCSVCNEPGGGFLGAGCSDTYSSTENGDQIRVGPRSEVNPYTGVFPYPYVNGWAQAGNALYKRMPIPNTAIASGQTIYAEAQYVTRDDAEAGNQMNNASFRKFIVGTLGSMGWSMTAISPTQREKSAIFAWQVEDPQVVIRTLDIPGDGRIFVGYRVHDLGGGMWHYEYAVQNFNSHRGVRQFSLPVGVATNIANIGFHDVDCHSNEPFSNTDWPGAVSAGVINWQTDTHEANVNANAIRWGTLYNFRFDANLPPTDGTLTLGLFKPGAEGSPTSITAMVSVPSAPPPPACAGDVNADQQVNGGDLSVLLAQFGQSVTPGTGADFNSDGVVNGSDLSVLLGNFGASC